MHKTLGRMTRQVIAATTVNLLLLGCAATQPTNGIAEFPVNRVSQRQVAPCAELSQTSNLDPLLLNLACKDLVLRNDRARRDFAIETVRQLDRLRPGDYTMSAASGGRTDEVRARISNPEANPPNALIACSYSDLTGLTLRLSEHIALRWDRRDPRMLLVLESSCREPIPASEVFYWSGVEYAHFIDSNQLNLCVTVRETYKHRVADLRLRLNSDYFEVRFEPVSGAAVPINVLAAQTAQ